MLLSSVVAMLNAVVIQHFSVTNAFNAIVYGFDTSLLPKGFNLGPAVKDITSLLNRGGMESMMSTLLIAFRTLSFAGVLSVRSFEQDCGVSAQDQQEYWLVDCRHPGDRHPDLYPLSATFCCLASC